MDPLSVALGIAGLLPLIAKAIQCAKEYKDGVSSARTSIATLISELEALQFNVTSLHEFLKADSGTGGEIVRFQQTSVLLVCSASCETKLQSLCRKLGREGNGKRSRFLWPFSEKEHQKTVQELRNFTTWMHFALSVDGCRVLSQTSDGVLQILGKQLEQFTAIQSLERTTDQIFDNVQAQGLILEKSQAQADRRDILDWISKATSSYQQKHQELRSSRTKDTGDWLLRSRRYSRWRNGDDLNKIGALWCHGIQGSGKTNLVSIIVDDLLSLQQTVPTPTPVAYFYFSHQDRLAQSPHVVLSCVLRQLLEQLPEIPTAVRSVYETTRTQGALPHFECERLVVEVLKDLTQSYLVLDALDECSDEHRGSLLRTLAQLDQQPQGARILVTSRPHINEIPATLKNLSTMRILAHDSDIQLYIRRELHQKGVTEFADEDFVEEVVQRLSTGAAGMFLLPVLQLRTILKEPSLGDMEDSLHGLSHSLSEAFEETIARIQSLSPNQRRIGMSALLYLVHARRPIAFDELSDLLAIHPGRRQVAPKYRPAPRTLLECCQGLVTIDARTGDVRTSHHSIQEYLMENDERLFPRAEAILAVNCLSYLLLEDFADGPWETEEEVESHIDSYPFLEYATRFFGNHAKPSEGDPDVQAELARFFASRPAMAVANQVRQYAMGRRREYWGPDEGLSFTPLHYAARHGLTQTVSRLLDQGVFDVNIATKQGATPIIHAASNGHAHVVRTLLERGADPYLRNWYGDALHCAVESNKAGSIRELVRWGMNPSGPGGPARRYMDCALDGDAAAALEALVQLGVDIHAEKACFRDGEEVAGCYSLPIFFQACDLGCEKIVGLMLDHGWVDVNAKSVPDGRTGLHWAARGRCLGVVRKLLDAGADVHAVDGDGMPALQLMREKFRASTLRAVLGSGIWDGRYAMDAKREG